MKRLVLLSLITLLLLGYTTSEAQTKRVNNRPQQNAVVEVLYFHAKQRCPTCIAVGNNAQEVVNKNFAVQVKKGQVKFKEIDISTPAGEKIADKYHVTWSSLFVNQLKNGKEKRNDMTRFGFEYARNSPEVYKNGLIKKITSLLK
jgi:hypothetical protein